MNAQSPNAMSNESLFKALRIIRRGAIARRGIIVGPVFTPDDLADKMRNEHGILCDGNYMAIRLVKLGACRFIGKGKYRYESGVRD